MSQFFKITTAGNLPPTVVETITGNDGVAEAAVSNNFNILTAGTTLKFIGSAGTETIDFALQNLLLGSTGSAITTADSNVGLGYLSLTSLTTGDGNLGIGQFAGASITDGTQNITIGYNTGSLINHSFRNTAIGYNALPSLDSAALTGENTAIGSAAGLALLSGTNNIFIGYLAGSAYSSSESSNISIGSLGVVAESNTIRIGEQGSGLSQQNKIYIAGIAGVTTSNTNIVTLDTTTGQLGAVNIIPVARGGTGANSLTGVLLGNGTSAITAISTVNNGVLITSATAVPSFLANGTTGQILTATTGSPPSWATPATLGNYVQTAVSRNILITDYIIGVTDTSAARTMTLPAVGAISKQLFIIKDESGGAAAFPIIVAAGTGTIDGAASVTIPSNYGAMTVYFNGTNYFVV